MSSLPDRHVISRGKPTQLHSFSFIWKTPKNEVIMWGDIQYAFVFLGGRFTLCSVEITPIKRPWLCAKSFPWAIAAFAARGPKRAGSVGAPARDSIVVSVPSAWSGPCPRSGREGKVSCRLLADFVWARRTDPLIKRSPLGDDQKLGGGKQARALYQRFFRRSFWGVS